MASDFPRIRIHFLAIAIVIATSACSKIDPDTIDNLQVVAEDWVPLEPRAPKEDPDDNVRVGHIVREGAGPDVAFGDLVQLRLRTPKSATGLPQSDQDATGWLWMGFQRRGSYEFATENDSLAAVLLSMKQGSVLTVTKNFRPHYGDTVGSANQMPFGRRDSYDAHMKKRPPGERAALNAGGVVFAEDRPDGDPTTVEILRVCKGAGSQRLITLTMSHPKRVGQDLGRTFEMKEPRYYYVREAKWEGRCDDGKTARYAFGPIRVERPLDRKNEGWDLDRAPYDWIAKMWETVPLGVRVE